MLEKVMQSLNATFIYFIVAVEMGMDMSFHTIVVYNELGNKLY